MQQSSHQLKYAMLNAIYRDYYNELNRISKWKDKVTYAVKRKYLDANETIILMKMRSLLETKLAYYSLKQKFSKYKGIDSDIDVIVRRLLRDVRSMYKVRRKRISKYSFIGYGIETDKQSAILSNLPSTTPFNYYLEFAINRVASYINDNPVVDNPMLFISVMDKLVEIVELFGDVSVPSRVLLTQVNRLLHMLRYT